MYASFTFAYSRSRVLFSLVGQSTYCTKPVRWEERLTWLKSHNGCISVLGLYPRDSLVDDVTRHCRHSTWLDVNNNGGHVREFPRNIVRSEPNYQEFNALTANHLLHSDVTWVTPPIVHIQNQAPTFVFAARSGVSVRSHRSEAGYFQTGVGNVIVQPALRKAQTAQLYCLQLIALV